MKLMYALLFIATLALAGTAWAQDACIPKIEKEASTPARQGLLASVCPKFAIKPAAEPFKDWFSRLKKHDWKDFRFTLGRADWKAIYEAMKWAGTHRFESKDMLDSLVRDHNTNPSQFDESAYRRFWIRLAPCFDGEHSTAASDNFKRWLEKDTEDFLNKIVEESKSVSKKDACLHEGDSFVSSVFELALSDMEEGRLSPSASARAKKATSPHQGGAWDEIREMVNAAASP